MGTSNCTINGQKSRGGNTYAEASVYMGYGSSNYYEYVLSFTTGNFSGKSQAITFSLQMGNSSQGASRTYRWALLNSDSSVVGRDSANLYFNKNTAVTDPNQLAQGTITWPDMNKDTQKVLTIETDAIVGTTNYFLVLWAYAASPTSLVTVSSIQNHAGVTVEHESSFLVKVNHYLMNASGSVSLWSASESTVEAGTVFTPTLIDPPTTNRSNGAIMVAFGTDGGGKVNSGTVVAFTVEFNTSAEIYYPLASGTVTVNIDGVPRLCEVNYKT